MEKVARGELKLVAGWVQWKPVHRLQHRRIELLPRLSMWYGGGKQVPWFIGGVILSVEFAWLFWNGQVTWWNR